MTRLKGLHKDLCDAVALAAAWAALLSLLLHGFVAGYFPLSDEWALLANSDPRFADPIAWLTRGFAGYFTEPPGLAGPYANFVRPVVNFCYWLQGLWLAPESGARLYFNYLVIGACSGACLLAMRATPLSRGLTLLFAAAVPLLPGFLPSSQLLFFPVMAFDPLVACLCILAAILYQREQFSAAALVLLVAALTKEASIPIAAALTALYVIEHRRALIAKDLRAWLRFAMLAAPVVLWLACRYALFGSLTQGTYTHINGANDALRFLPRTIVRVPFWFDRKTDLTIEARPLMMLANAAVMIAALAAVGRRWIRHGRPHPFEIALVVSYVFMLRYGETVRFGAVMDVFLVACTALWLGDPSSRKLGAVVAAGLVLGLIATHRHGVKDLEARRDALIYDHDVARRYVQTLRDLPREAPVVVLNDPATWFSRLEWLLRLEGISASVVKVADAECYMPRSNWLQQCSVSLRDEGQRRYRFEQSCGLDLCGAAPGRGRTTSYSPAPGIAVELDPGATQRADERTGGRWRSLRVSLGNPDARLLYFDPATDAFRIAP